MPSLINIPKARFLNFVDRMTTSNKAKDRWVYYYDHEDFKWLLSDKQYQMFDGGRGSGKSYSITEALILWADLIDARFLLCRELMNSIADSCHSQMESHIDNLGLTERFTINKTTIKSNATGSEFIYKGLKNSIQSVKSLNKIQFTFVEEAQTVSEASWKILLPSVMRTDGCRMVIACNPEDGESFMAKRWILNPCANTIRRQVNYNKNSFFPAELENERQYALSLIATAPNEDARLQAQADYDWIWEGAFKRILASQVIRRAELKEFETPENVRFYYGGDFGFSVDPNAFTRSFIIGRDLYVDYEAVGRCEIDELPELLTKSIPGIKEWPVYCDAARPETISALYRAGFNASSAEKWAGSVEDGLSFLNQFDRIYIHPRCKYTWQETRDYRYKTDKLSGDVLPILIDANNHCFDSLRYAHYTNIKSSDSFFDTIINGADAPPVDAAWLI